MYSGQYVSMKKNILPPVCFVVKKNERKFLLSNMCLTTEKSAEYTIVNL
jgi:hypothetical protein